MIQKNNRKEILDAAYWLFYEQGYSSTSLEDIGRRCNITKQAIAYHFGTKSGLGREVASLIAERIHNNFVSVVCQYLPDTSFESINAANLIWFSRVYSHDEKAFRFYKEFILQDENFVDLMEVLQPNYEKRLSGGNINPVQGVKQLAILSAFYSARGLLLHYSMGTLSCSPELFEQYYFNNFYEPFYSEAEVRNLYREGKSILIRLGEAILPYDQSKFM